MDFWINSMLLGAGLAMDAVSVSIADALRETQLSRRRICLTAAIYAGFQALMPLLGWGLVRYAAGRLHWFATWIPRTGGGLLVWIGWDLLREGGDSTETETHGETPENGMIGAMAKAGRIGTLLLQGLATSMDALSVGFAIAPYSMARAAGAAGIIAAVTFCLCVVGMKLGRRAGKALSRRAPAVGGLILVALGLNLLLRS